MSTSTDDTESESFYYDSVADYTELVEEKITALEAQKEAISTLAERVATVDCDVGTASMEFAEHHELKTVTVVLTAYGHPDEVEQIVEGYNWDKRREVERVEIGSDECDTVGGSTSFQWTLKASIEALAESDK